MFGYGSLGNEMQNVTFFYESGYHGLAKIVFCKTLAKCHLAQNDLERHENRLFCFCECPSAREMIFVNLVDLIMPLLLICLLFGRPVKSGHLRTRHRNIQKGGFRVVSNHFVPNAKMHDASELLFSFGGFFIF